MALVITLAILVLMVGLAMAFLSRVLQDRSIRSASASRDQSAILARSALGLILGDLFQEIAAGSEQDLNDPGADGVSYFAPRAVPTSLNLLGSNIPISGTPSIALQRTVSGTLAASHPNLMKESRSGIPFFSVQSGTDSGYVLRPEIGSPSARASSVSTTTPARLSRGIPESIWELPSFGSTATPPNAVPDWIYLDRSGNTPVFPGNQVIGEADKTSTNPDYVIGRFAYRIYDVGGLLDLNLLGNPTNPAGSGNRESLADVALAPAPDLPGLPNGSELLNLATWRAGDGSGPRPFVSRQEMLRTLAAREEIPSDAFRWFHVGSRFADRPSFGTDPELLATTPSALEADLLNPPLPGVRFENEFNLERGTEPDIPVAAGSPVMLRKFPLRKIDLLSDPSTSQEDLTYYFGLTRQPDGSFRYSAADANGVIKDLRSVADEEREPNFFEVLQAVIATGSLGRNAGNSYTIDNERDGLRSRQTWQIGANIIDQWDSDDYPTTIQYFVPVANEWVPVYGVENLPYLNNITILGHRPQWDRDRFQVWALFDVWNPHQTAANLPTGIDSFRIAARGGVLRLSINLTIYEIGGAPVPAVVHGSNLSNDSDIDAINQGRGVVFEPASFINPTRIGESGPPTNAMWNGGVLLNDFPNVPPPVPADIQARKAEFPSLVVALDNYLDNAKPSPLPRIADQGGEFGAKAHNFFRIRSVGAEAVSIDLQYRKSPTAPWITYQSIEDCFHSASTTVTDGRETLETLLQDTLISEDPSNTSSHFYGWKIESPGSATDDLTRNGFTLVKYDPRTVRFGHNELRRTQIGRTIRQSSSLPPIPSDNIARDLTAERMMLRVGNAPYSTFVAGVQSAVTWEPADAMQWVPTGVHFLPFGSIANIPEEALNTTFNPSRYRDRDGIIRPGDGYLGAVPTVVPLSPGDTKGSLGDRPVILNRPFHSVGEIGYAFRDLPWKSLDFFSRNSADLGLLDAFSIEPVDGDRAVVEGKINLNSVSETVLAALLERTARLPDGTKPISSSEAESFAADIVQERTANGPYSSVGDVVRRALSPLAHNMTGAFNPVEHRKAEREAVIRTLSAIGDTRSWNLMVDLVVQSGHLAPDASQPDQFLVDGEKHYWVHLALDRITGELIHQNWEPVYE